MKRALLIVSLFALALTMVVPVQAAQSKSNAQSRPASAAGAQSPANGANNNAALEKVLNQMDAAAANFKTLQAQFIWDQYSKIVNEHDLQKGTIYFRRTGSGMEMSANIVDPARKYVLFTDSKVQVYQPTIEQVTEYNAGKNKAEFESFLVLGFGGRGHDLAKSFDVKYAGGENIGGINTAKLELTPKSPKVRNMFDLIILWIDPARGLSVQQQFMEPSGDYRLAKYSDIKMNPKLSDDFFKLKTTSKTKVLKPQG
jgi:outer membrane lipoprotein-sorting protein